MKPFTKNQELIAECKNKITYAMTLLDVSVKKKTSPTKIQIDSALKDLRIAAKLLSKINL